MISQAEYGKKSINQLIKGYFDGSPARLVSQFITDHKLSGRRTRTLTVNKSKSAQKQQLMSYLIYIIKTIFISGVLFGYYWLFLRNRPFHTFNRYFLLSIPVLSFLLPAFHLNFPSFWNQNVPVSPILLLETGQGKLEEAVTIYANQHSGVGFSWQSALWILSISISFFFFLVYLNLFAS